MKARTYVCCDLKSFYASVECVERGLDPMTTNLVVADKRRTDKTICLAVSPSLKAYGIAGRARLFEVVQKVAEVNAQRQWNVPGHQLTGSSWHDPDVQKNPSLALDYIVAPPRMAHYIDWSTIYLKYIAPEDIYPYSIDEVFMDLTNYLDIYQLTARDLTRTIILDILKTTGITAAAGMGTNLYLAKVSMDIVAKHAHPDKDGVCIAKLNEMTYRRLLWNHRPLTDFWRVGKGYATKLEAHGMYTLGDIARCSIGKPGEYYNEELLYKLFGINAELLIDHAWGWEPCTIADAKAYKPENKSIVSGQVLQCPYNFQKARLVVREMADSLALDLVDKGLFYSGGDTLVLVVVFAVAQLVIQFQFQAIFQKLSDGFLEQILDIVYVADIFHLQQLSNLLSTGVFFRGSVLSGHMLKSSCLVLLFYTTQEVYTKVGLVSGIPAVTEECLLSAMALNLKRMAKYPFDLT